MVAEPRPGRYDVKLDKTPASATALKSKTIRMDPKDFTIIPRSEDRPEINDESPVKRGRHRKAKKAAKIRAAQNGTSLEVENQKSIERLRIVRTFFVFCPCSHILLLRIDMPPASAPIAHFCC